MLWFQGATHQISDRAVPNSLDTTFRLLAESPNTRAEDVLLAAIGSRYPPIWSLAVGTTMKRAWYAGHLELLRRLDPMDPQWRAVVYAPPIHFTASLRRAIQEDDTAVCRNACRVIVWNELFDFIPALAAAMQRQPSPNREVLGQALMELSEMLATRLTQPSADRQQGALNRVVGQVRSALEKHILGYSSQVSREVLEVYLLVAGSDTQVLNSILQVRSHPAYKALLKALETNTASPVLRLLASYIAQPQAPAAALRVIGRRTDPRFLRHLLRRVGSEPSPTVRRNIRRICQFHWLQSGLKGLELFDDNEQRAVVQLVRYSHLSREERYRLLERVLLQGKPGGREAAAVALEDYRGAEANALALKALDDPHPGVQAAILPQLRRRGIPGALPRIAGKLDSPHSIVRRAARRSLAEFSFRRFLGTWDLLEPEIQQSTGMLVRKVDPQTQPMLRAELASPLRSRRLRALAVAVTLELVPQLERSILPLLHDDDHLVRAEAAAALARSDSPWSREALLAALADPNFSVREAAQRSLLDRYEELPAPEPQKDAALPDAPRAG